MKTRREMAAALLGLPLAAAAATQDVSTVEVPKPLPDPDPDPGALKDIQPFSETAVRIVSYTIYAEARGEPFDGMKAVASVIKTRSIHARIPLAEVCRQDRQFSCWNEIESVPGFYVTGEGIKPRDMKARSQCFGIAWALLVSREPWDYFTHYYNPDKVTPDWAFSLKGVRTIGRHVFGYID